MATGGEQDQLSESTCSVCFEHYRLPKVLPCSHVFCHLCLRSMATATDSGFSCPICRQEVNITAQGVDALQTCARSTALSAAKPVDEKIKKNPHFPYSGTATDTFSDASVLRMDRKPLQEMYETIHFSNNSGTTVQSITLTAENKLWLRYQPSNNHASFISVYNTKGELLGRYIEESVKGDSLTCLGDVLLSPLTWRWIDPDGRSGSLDLSPNDWAKCSKSLPPHILLRTSFSENNPNTKVNFSVHCLQQLSTNPLSVTMTPVITEGLTLDDVPTSFDIVCNGRWLAFALDKKIEIKYTDGETVKSFSEISVYSRYDSDIAFTTLEGQLVLVQACSINVRIYDFQDGFVILKSFDSDQQDCRYCYNFLAAHKDGKIWLNFKRGHIQVKDVTSPSVVYERIRINRR